MSNFRWVFPLLLTVFCSGCFGARELNQRAFVVAIAFDAMEGESTAYKITIQMPIPAQMGADQKGGGKTFYVTSITGDTVSSALDNLQRELDREIFLGHVRLMLFGEKLARKQGIEDVIDYFKRDFRVQRIAQLAIVHGEAGKMLNAEPPLEQSASQYINNILSAEAGASEEVTTDLGEYLVLDSDDGVEPVLPRLEPKGKNIISNGVGVMFHDKVKGWLNPSETRGLSIINNNFQPVRMVVNSPHLPGEKIGVEIREAKAKQKIFLKNGKLHAVTTIKGGFQTIEFTGEQGPQPSLEKALEQAVTQAVIHDVKAAIRRSQSLHADIIGYGRIVRAFYPSYWSKVQWAQAFSELEIKVKGKMEWTQSVRRPGQ